MTNKTKLLAKKEIIENLSEINRESLKGLDIFNKIGSTNDEAKKKLKFAMEFQQPFAIFAEKQYAGRGRSGKKWSSPAYCNIYLSFAWSSSLEAKQLEGLSLSTAVEISQSLAPILNESLKIKWPNDLFLSGKKVGGILVETSLYKKRTGIVIGVGLNVLMTREEKASIDQDWTSLSLHFGKFFDRNLIGGVILNSLLDLKNNFEEKGFFYYKNSFNELNLLLNRECTIVFNGKTMNGIVEGVTKNGELIFRENGKVLNLRYGQVSLTKIS